jgi:ferrous iron transport protein B
VSFCEEKQKTLNSKPKIALLGNPNSGKTSLFNQMTGLRQKTGNFPGVTVDKVSGAWKLNAEISADVLDLPGIYSIYPKTLDEQVVLDILANPKSKHFPDLAIVVADASNLKRNLLLFSQIRDLGIPTVLALNMLDVAENQGVIINSIKLARELNVPVAEINSKKGIGMNGLKLEVIKALEKKHASNDLLSVDYEPEIVEEINEKVGKADDYMALLWLSEHEKMSFFSKKQNDLIEEIEAKHKWNKISYESEDTIKRYETLNEIVEGSTFETKKETISTSWTTRLDSIFLHRFWGYFIFLGILFIVFQAVFTWATYPQDLLDTGIANLISYLKTNLPESQLTDLLTDGLISGIGGVVLFIPQIAFLFAFISLLEESGYMSRVMFIMDKLMRRFGLSGRSVVPLISSVACAVPAIMATRSIASWKDRLITIMVTPLMSCSARLPIYTILIALVVPEKKAFFGLFNLQGLVLFGLYLLGFVAAILSALVMKMILKPTDRSYFIMELPTYKGPRFEHVMISIINSVKAFVFEAGKVIVAISIILWVLASYGPGNAMQEAENRVIANSSSYSKQDLQNKIASQRLEYSYAGHFGKLIEPGIKPLGYDWKIGIALITSFAAREVFVGTMSTIYSIGSDADGGNTTIKNKIAAEINPDTGKPMYTPALGFSLLIFYAFAMQCMSTLATTYRETKKWKYPIIQLVYMTALAYISAFIVYQLMK